MFEIALHNNYTHLAQIALEYCKMLDKRLMPNSHVLAQFTEDSSVGKLSNGSDKV